MKMKKEIDYYGDTDNYIHLKFGDARKMYHFTPDFIEKYPDFAREYANYWDGTKSAFKNPFQVVSYAYDNKLPVHFYFNFTDTPAESKEQILDYLRDEQSYIDLEHNIKFNR